ncbi:Hypothetical predicted protein [Mytilus galloprovincialis]|uniref:B box-type domain-containing protein n=1 Tax=Mytilus galloprovincialis TaxID=29158 RepID=A0A8B6BSL4_MYTGA|nr:Hypothetical predicted protein [Mytilus galloprovincialis]
MASVISCGPCLYDETHQNASKWCTSCEEGLCKDCEKTHRKTKTTRDHKLISIDNYRKIKDVPISLDCSVHDKKLEWFCKSHDKTLCVVCLPTEHRSCSDVIPIDVAAAKSRQSTAMSDLQEAIEVTLRNITLCISNRNTARKDIEKQEKDIRTIVKVTRTKINNYLDKLEEKLIQTLASESETCNSKCNNFLQQFNTQEVKMIKLKDQVYQMKEFASDLQVFLGTRQIDKLVMSETESIKTAAKSMYDYKFNLVLNSDIQKLSNALVKEFGDIQVTEHTTDLDLKELKIEQAQMHQNVQPPSYHGNVAGVKLKLITKFDIKQEGFMFITGCAVLPNGHLLFANYTNKQNLFEYSEDGNYIGSIHVSAHSYDITVLDFERIAITYGNKRFFEIFNYRKNLVEKKIETGGDCYGLSQSNGKIYVRQDQVGVFDIMGKKLCNRAISGTLFISASKNNLFSPNCSNNNVCCFDMNGHEKWNFHDDFLRRPYGLANDRSGNVFVVGCVSKNLIVVQHDGKTYKNLLNFDKHSSPRGVCYNEDRNILLYYDEEGDHCALYSVLYT